MLITRMRVLSTYLPSELQLFVFEPLQSVPLLHMIAYALALFVFYIHLVASVCSIEIAILATY